MRVLVLATKPPWPPRDGGRLALWSMLQALAEQGHRLHLLAPADADVDADVAREAMAGVVEAALLPLRPRPWPLAALASLGRGRPLALARHHHPALVQALRRCCDRLAPEVLHVEQLQAWSHVAALGRSPVPAVLRMQNVESALWAQQAGGGIAGWPWRIEAARLRRAEAQAMREAATVLAISDCDAASLRGIADPAVAPRIHTLLPPFAVALPAGPALPGAPAIVLFGSGGWRPNRAAAWWFQREVAPRLARSLPEARVHVFGPDALPGAAVNLCVHPAPADAAAAYAQGALAAVPLFTGSGIRMRILDAWARGLPVVASPRAAAGLPARDGEHLLVVDGAEAMAAALARLHAEPALQARLVEAGRALLRERFAAPALAADLLGHYRRARG
jgi:polysaccharide biosynthesis protein PslH